MAVCLQVELRLGLKKACLQIWQCWGVGAGMSLLYGATVILAQLQPDNDELMLTHYNGNRKLTPSPWPDALVLMQCNHSHSAQGPGTMVRHFPVSNPSSPREAMGTGSIFCIKVLFPGKVGTYLFQGLHKTPELTDFLEGNLACSRCSVHLILQWSLCDHDS